MQIGGTSSLLTLKTKNKKTLYSNYSFVFFVILSITLITLDIKNIITYHKKNNPLLFKKISFHIVASDTAILVKSLKPPAENFII